MGFIIKQLQETLKVQADGWFGKETKGALEALQASKNIPVTGEYGPKEAEILGLEWPNDFLRILNVASQFEGTGFSKAVGPKQTGDSAGVTFGLIGFTSGNGELQKLMAQLIEAFPDLADIGKELMERRWGAVSSLIYAPDNRAFEAEFIHNGSVDHDLKRMLEVWGLDKRVQQVQIDKAYNNYWLRAERIIRRLYHGEIAPRSKGLVYDFLVQNGLPEYLLEAIEKRGLRRESDINQALLDATIDRINKKYHVDVKSRKNTFIQGVGRVHGQDYDLTQYAL